MGGPGWRAVEDCMIMCVYVCASPDTCKCNFVKASLCIQRGRVQERCVSGGFILPVFASECTQGVLQAQGLRNISQGST